MKVTIIMATYNRAHFIIDSLQSIQKQTFKEWECLIVDDGGSDNTEEVISELLKEDVRFKFLKRPNNYLKGLPGCRNFGLDSSKGEYVIFFDDDDIVHPQNLEYCIEVIKKGNIDFCHYKKKAFLYEVPNIINNTISFNKIINKAHIGEIIEQNIALASCTVMWSKKCFKNNRFIETLMYAEEWECYSRIVSEGYIGIEIENVLYFNRKHPNSNTGKFYNNDLTRIDSKKEAIRLVTKNLITRNLMTLRLLKYLSGFALSFRDQLLLNDILRIGKGSLKIKLFLFVKYYLFPIWKIYKNAIKRFYI